MEISFTERIDSTMNFEKYNLLWKAQSKNSGESMPLGGYDTGCNVWVEDNALLLYLAQSGAFDESGNMLKAGRIRISFEPEFLAEEFSQQLRLSSGDILIRGKGGSILLWADTSTSAVHVQMSCEQPVKIRCAYELWREQDSVSAQDGKVVFYHRNQNSNILDERLSEQGIEHLREYFPDVEKNRTSGGMLSADGMMFCGNGAGKYMNHAFRSWILESEQPVTQQEICIYLHVAQTDSAAEWVEELETKAAKAAADTHAREKTLEWWNQFWQRSFVDIKPGCNDEQDIDWQVGRNYQLFRYMLAANAYGEFPTKFNGGLFTVDAEAFVDGHKGSPDWRDWGGIMFTAQNQRLVYWGMIKNGDFDMMKPAFEFYRRLVLPLKKRTEHFFGLKDCACYCEQIDANGLSSHYGKYGVDYPLQVRHHYVEALEFCFMILNYHLTSGKDITPYLDFVLSVLNFYDYRYCKLNQDGKRIIYPSTAMETYHASPLTEIYGKEGVEAANYCDEQTAVTNPADVIAGLRDTLDLVFKIGCFDADTRKRLEKFRMELAEIPLEYKHDHLVVAPCEFPKKYFKGNCEIPQLNTVYPYHMYGIDKPDLQIARDTYDYAWDEPDQLSHISWHTNGVYAARIGNTDEAVKYMRLKLGDSGRKFPAFWGPGHDYTPDHNWGGSGMIGVQEMLMQNFDGKIYLLPAWDLSVDVSFKLWADHGTAIEVVYQNQKLGYKVTPASRLKDVICPQSVDNFIIS